jgi:hypothetical protein
MKIFNLLVICFIVVLIFHPAASQEGPKKFFGEKSVVPEIPPKEERMRATLSNYLESSSPNSSRDFPLVSGKYFQTTNACKTIITEKNANE